MRKAEIRAVTEAIRAATSDRNHVSREAMGQYLDGYVDGLKTALREARRAPKREGGPTCQQRQ